MQRMVGKYAGDNREILVEPLGQDHYRVTIDGVQHDVDAAHFEGGTWNLLIDGESYDVELENAAESEQDGEYRALVRGEAIELTVQDERRVRLGAGDSREEGGPQKVIAPMPGKIVKVLVEEGDTVAEGTPLIVIEAMKMENELRSPGPGTIAKILVEAGQTVESKTALINMDE